MTTLIMTLPGGAANAAATLDYIASADGLALNTQTTVTLGNLTAPADRQAEVVAVVPAQRLSWHRVQLPQGSLPRSLGSERAQQRLRAILESQLEEHLLDEPAQLHFALQPQPDTRAPVWVAVCERAWLKAALEALAQTGHVVARIVPECTPQALNDAIHVSGDADAARLTALTQASTPDATPGVLACPLSPAALALLGEAAAARPILAEPAVAALAEQTFKRPVVLQQRAQRLLQAAQTSWDLAQFDLAHAGRRSVGAQLAQGLRSFASAPQWRAGRWALAALALANLVGLNAWALHEQAGLQAQRQKIRAVLTDTFPKVGAVVDAPVQMQRELAALQRASGTLTGADLERVLAAFAQAAPKGHAVTSIDYTSNEARLGGPPISDQESVLDGLAAQGLSASVQGEQWLIRAEGKP